MVDFMNSYAWTIAGGSDEVQRNIISERMLGMPREPKGWVVGGAGMSIDRAELQDAARRRSAGDRARARRDESWGLIAEMGWLMMAVPEELGGLGLGRDGAAILYASWAACSRPAVPSGAAGGGGDFARRPRSTDREGWIERLIGGEIVTADDGAVADTRTDDSGTTFDRRGSKRCPTPTRRAISWLVSREDAVPPSSRSPTSSVSVIQRNVWDESRKLFDVELNEAPVEPGLVLASGEDAVRMVQDLCCPSPAGSPPIAWAPRTRCSN